jgi:preprotein translocase subunit SecG
MFGFVITIHVLACILLILIVMVQQGKGGGLIATLSSAESIFGTKTNTFLIKSTSVLAVIFFITCLSLAFLSIQKNKSLIETSYKPSSIPATAPSAPQAAAATTSTTPQAPAAPVPPAAQVIVPAQAQVTPQTQPAQPVSAPVEKK